MPDRYRQMGEWVRALTAVDDPRLRPLVEEIRDALCSPCPCCSGPPPAEPDELKCPNCAAPLKVVHGSWSIRPSVTETETDREHTSRRCLDAQWSKPGGET